MLCCFPWLAIVERTDPDRPAVGTSPLSPRCNASHRDYGTADKIIRETGGEGDQRISVLTNSVSANINTLMLLLQITNKIPHAPRHAAPRPPFSGWRHSDCSQWGGCSCTKRRPPGHTPQHRKTRSRRGREVCTSWSRAKTEFLSGMYFMVKRSKAQRRWH